MNDDYWICGWSENNTYMVFDGKLTDDSVDEFKQVKKLFLLNSHDMPIASMSNDFPMNSPE